MDRLPITNEICPVRSSSLDDSRKDKDQSNKNIILTTMHHVLDIDKMDSNEAQLILILTSSFSMTTYSILGQLE